MIFNQLNQLNQVLPSKGRIMALDIGSKRIGIAISDEDRFLATPKTILHRQSNQKDFTKIKQFIDENKISLIVVGWPLNMDETTSEMSKFVEKFCLNFNEFLEKKIPIFLCDERLTSYEAREIATSKLSRKKEFYDDIAASLILEGFLRQSH